MDSNAKELGHVHAAESKDHSSLTKLKPNHTFLHRQQLPDLASRQPVPEFSNCHHSGSARRGSIVADTVSVLERWISDSALGEPERVFAMRRFLIVSEVVSFEHRPLTAISSGRAALCGTLKAASCATQS
jgi:hypothetical protein